MSTFHGLNKKFLLGVSNANADINHGTKHNMHDYLIVYLIQYGVVESGSFAFTC